jgi:ATP/maltotriose-dependent transcriptional regulator MalT
LTQEEISVVDSKSDLGAVLSNEAVSEWLKSGQKKGTRSWKMRYGEANMGNRHYIEMAVNELERENEEE